MMKGWDEALLIKSWNKKIKERERERGGKEREREREREI